MSKGAARRRTRRHLGLWLASMLAVAAIARAGGGPPPPDFTPHGSQPGLFYSLEEPLACASCHGFAPSPESEFLAHSTWQGSLMANATRDPIFWAALDVAERDAAEADVPGVGDWCLRCHTPTGWFAGRVRKDGLGGLVNGTNGCLLMGQHDLEDFSDNDYAGVTCHLCHRMTEAGPNGEVSPQRGSGNVWVDDDSCGGFFEPCRYGPYAYPPGSPLEAPHAARYSAFTVSSRQCGTCHDVSSPLLGSGTPMRTLIRDGVDTGIAFPAERTFSEWRVSGFADVLLADSLESEGVAVPTQAPNIECQDCHMRTSQDPTAFACQQSPSGYRAGELPVHEFVGGGVWALRILKGLYGTALMRNADFDRTIAWSLELLQARSAQIAVNVDSWPGAGSPLDASVRVTNLSGHKLPTGYAEGRRMWIRLTARDGMGVPFFTSGAWDADTGILSEDAQLKVYESLQGVWNVPSGTCQTEDLLGRKQFHFVLNNCIAKDNRIPPQGFRVPPAGDPLEAELMPVGYTYPETAPGSGVLVNFDVTEYSIPVPPGTMGPLTVEADLLYQTSSKEYIEFLRDEAVENAQPSENAMCGRSWSVGPANQSRGVFLFDLWNGMAYGKSPPVTMVSASASAP